MYHLHPYPLAAIAAPISILPRLNELTCLLRDAATRRFLGGVTRTLNVSYLRAVPVGTTVRISAEVVQVGKTMALIVGRMTSPDGETVYCTCEHHKVNVPTRRAHRLAKISWDEEFDRQHGTGVDGAEKGKAKL